MNSRNGVEFLNGAWTIIPLIAPDITRMKRQPMIVYRMT